MTNIDMSGVLPTDYIGGHGDDRKIVFNGADIGTTVLKVTRSGRNPGIGVFET